MAQEGAEFEARLAQFSESASDASLEHGQAHRECSVAFVFGGQGPQVLGAGRSIYENDPTFRDLLDEICTAALEYWPRDVRQVLWEDASLWDTVDIQPALFCLQVGMARLWRHYGIGPSVVLGHSLGEYAAACVAGVFSFEAGLRLVTSRARLLGDLPPRGQMLVVLAPAERVESLLPSGLDIAAINGPRQTVVAGPDSEVRAWTATLSEQEIRYQELVTTHAFHSSLVDPILEPFGEVAR